MIFFLNVNTEVFILKPTVSASLILTSFEMFKASLRIVAFQKADSLNFLKNQLQKCIFHQNLSSGRTYVIENGWKESKRKARARETKRASKGGTAFKLRVRARGSNSTLQWTEPPVCSNTSAFFRSECISPSGATQVLWPESFLQQNLMAQRQRAGNKAARNYGNCPA